MDGDSGIGVSVFAEGGGGGGLDVGGGGEFNIMLCFDDADTLCRVVVGVKARVVESFNPLWRDCAADCVNRIPEAGVRG